MKIVYGEIKNNTDNMTTNIQHKNHLKVATTSQSSIQVLHRHILCQWCDIQLKPEALSSHDEQQNWKAFYILTQFRWDWGYNKKTGLQRPQTELVYIAPREEVLSWLQLTSDVWWYSIMSLS